MLNIKKQIKIKFKYKSYGYFSYPIYISLIFFMILFIFVGTIVTIIATYYFSKTNLNLIILGIILFLFGVFLTFLLSLNFKKKWKNIHFLNENGYKQIKVFLDKVLISIYIKNKKKYTFYEAMNLINNIKKDTNSINKVKGNMNGK